MIEQVRRNFSSGIEKIRWYSGLVGERIKVEMAVIKLMGKADKLKRERERLAQSIGDRIFESRATLPDSCKDDFIKNILVEMEMVNEELDELTARMTGISKPQQ